MNDRQRAMLLDVIAEWAGIVNDAYSRHKAWAAIRLCMFILCTAITRATMGGRSPTSQTRLRLITVKYFSLRIASPENVTEVLIVQFQRRLSCDANDQS
jgi:hypothetical protein